MLSRLGPDAGLHGGGDLKENKLFCFFCNPCYALLHIMDEENPEVPDYLCCFCCTLCYTAQKCCGGDWAEWEEKEQRWYVYDEPREWRVARKTILIKGFRVLYWNIFPYQHRQYLSLVLWDVHIIHTSFRVHVPKTPKKITPWFIWTRRATDCESKRKSEGDSKFITSIKTRSVRILESKNSTNTRHISSVFKRVATLFRGQSQIV